MLILLIDIDVVESNVVKSEVINGVFFDFTPGVLYIDGVYPDLTMLYIDGLFPDLTLCTLLVNGVLSDMTLLYVDVDWMNEDVWKKVIIDDLIVVVNSVWSSILCVVVGVNEIELQDTNRSFTCTLQHKLSLVQLSVEHDIRTGDGREQSIVIDFVQWHSQLLSHIQYWSC